jgi:hypothetical protein
VAEKLVMFDFCPHCGNTLGGQDQVAGHMVVCRTCGKDIGIVSNPSEKVLIDQAAEIIQSGTAARCPVCNQLVQIKTTGTGRSLVPHAGAGGKPRMCPGGGKPVATAPSAVAPVQAVTAATPAKKPGKDLSAYMNREHIQVVACRREGGPTIEVLDLEYLDRADRVRLQIEALRDILGKAFQMRPYPPSLQRPQLAVWANADGCVVGKKHEQGGYQPLSAEEVKQVIADMQAQRQLFFS